MRRGPPSGGQAEGYSSAGRPSPYVARFVEDLTEPDLDALGEELELVVLNFRASWCGPCKRQDPVFARASRTVCEETPEAPVVLANVDVDRNQALATDRRVKSVPTTLILAKEDGLLWGTSWREKARFQGVVPYQKLLDEIEEQLSGLTA